MLTPLEIENFTGIDPRQPIGFALLTLLLGVGKRDA